MFVWKRDNQMGFWQDLRVCDLTFQELIIEYVFSGTSDLICNHIQGLNNQTAYHLCECIG